MSFTPEQIDMLKAKLDGAYVKPPPQGKYGSYLEGWRVIDEANRIFGFDGWSYSVNRLDQTNASEKDGKHFVGYLAMVTVSIHNEDDIQDLMRQDVGHGSGVSRNEGDAHESAIKEAVTDGLKRALRTFGNPFGLALYDKSGDNVEHAAPAPKPNKTTVSPAFQQQKAEDLIRIIKATTTLDDLVEIWTDEADNLRSLPASWRETITAAKDEQKRKLQQTPVDAL